MTLYTHHGLPIASLGTHRKLARLSLATINGLGPLPGLSPLPGALPAPHRYWPFDTDAIDLIAGAEYGFAGTIQTPGWYDGYLAISANLNAIVPSAGDVSAIWWRWGLVGGIWEFIGWGYDEGGTIRVIQVGGTTYLPGEGPVSVAWTGEDEMAMLTFAEPISVAAAAVYLSAAYNDGIGVVWRDGQWWEVAGV